MKKFLTILTMINVFALQTFAQSQYAAILSKMENSLFGVEYVSQSDTSRLDRIEKMVYGESSSGAVTSRIAKLKNDVNADLFEKEIKPVEDSFMDEDGNPVYEEVPKEDKSVKYLVVDTLEQRVFHRGYQALDIKSRLSNLEKQTFSQTFDNDDLNTRVERLKAQVMPKQETAAESENNDDNYSAPDNFADSFYDDSSYERVSKGLTDFQSGFATKNATKTFNISIINFRKKYFT